MASESVETGQSNATARRNRTHKRTNRNNRNNNSKTTTTRPNKQNDNNTTRKQRGNKINASTSSSPQRTQEIKQCQDLLSHKQFKLYKNGGHASSFGFIPSQRSQEKFTINVPYEYPRQPLKVDVDMESISQEQQLKYDNLIRNFNRKCKNDAKNKSNIPIISQLNYLLTSRSTLMTNSPQEFNNLTTLQSSFYSQFA